MSKLPPFLALIYHAISNHKGGAWRRQCR